MVMDKLLQEIKQTVLVPEGTVVYSRQGVRKCFFKVKFSQRFVLNDEYDLLPSLKFVSISLNGKDFIIENAVIENGCVTQAKES